MGKWGNHWPGQVSAHVEAEVAVGGFSSGVGRAGQGTAVTRDRTGLSPYQLPDVGELCPPPNFYLTSGALTAHSGQEENGFPVGTGRCAHH